MAHCKTNNGLKGGNLVGNSHKKGGIKAKVVDTGQLVELEGGEVIINKKASEKHHKELSKINQSAGNGVPILPPNKASKMKRGGKISDKKYIVTDGKDYGIIISAKDADEARKKGNREFWSPFPIQKRLDIVQVYEKGKHLFVSTKGNRTFDKIVFHFSGDGAGRVTNYNANIDSKITESQKEFIGNSKIDYIKFFNKTKYTYKQGGKISDEAYLKVYYAHLYPEYDSMAQVKKDVKKLMKREKMSMEELLNQIPTTWKKGGKMEDKKDKHVINIDGYSWFLEKIDNTHFYMSNDKNHRGMAHHIRQHNGEPYYDEVKNWLKDTFKAGGKMKSYKKENNIMNIAKKIRKPNEKWQDAVKRASKMKGKSVGKTMHKEDNSNSNLATLYKNKKITLQQYNFRKRAEELGIKTYQYYSKGGKVGSNPSIYLSDIAAYNEGKLVGEWIDLTDFSDADELMDEIQTIVDKWSEEQGVEREEWAIHDYENIPSNLASEYMGESDFEAIYEMIEVSDNTGLPFEVIEEWMSHTGNDTPESFEDAYYGTYEDEEDFAYQLVEDGAYTPSRYEVSVTDTDRRIIAGEEMDNSRENSSYEELSEDETEELAEEQYNLWYDGLEDPIDFLVDEMGIYSEEEALKLNFIMIDYSAIAENLSYDYTFIDVDGETYVFMSNYKSGGTIKKKYKKGGQLDFDFTTKTKKRPSLSKIKKTKKMATKTKRKAGFFGEKKEQTGGSYQLPDKQKKAMKPGKRVSKAGHKNQYGTTKGGNVYTETRMNRSDVDGRKKLAKGGSISKSSGGLFDWMF
jgi:antirestriction protein